MKKILIKLATTFRIWKILKSFKSGEIIGSECLINFLNDIFTKRSSCYLEITRYQQPFEIYLGIDLNPYEVKFPFLSKKIIVHRWSKKDIVENNIELAKHIRRLTDYSYNMYTLTSFNSRHPDVVNLSKQIKITKQYLKHLRILKKKGYIIPECSDATGCYLAKILEKENAR